MYRADQYVNDDPAHVWEFIHANPFATLVQQGEELIATHIPVLAQGESKDFRLFGHIANHNHQLASIRTDAKALLIFHGPHSYISSSWYTEQEVSTWNYLAVHINVRLKVQTGQELRECLQLLTDRFEAAQPNPLYYKDIDTNVIESQIGEITGFWMYPERIQGIAKLSQKIDRRDIDSIATQLSSQPAKSTICAHILTANDKDH